MANKQALDRPQPFRVHYKRGSSPTAIETEVVYIAAYHDDAAGKDIVLWDDISIVFRGIEHVRDGEENLPFLTDANNIILEPRRIKANQDRTYDVETEC